MFDIDDVLTLTALLPVVTMDTHKHSHIYSHTHTHTHTRELQQQLVSHCAAQLCAVWAPMHTMGTAILVNSSRKQRRWKRKARREGERERGVLDVFDKSMSNRRSSWAVQWQSPIGISLSLCVLALYSDFLLARQRK